MGPAAVSCICAPGYTGDLCESLIAAPECGIEECSEGCKKGTSCDCNPKDTDVSSARFETRLQIMDQGTQNISEEIIKQITNYLMASNITLHDEIEILNISSPDINSARTVWLRVWGARREAGALRTALARLAATRTRTDRLRLLPATLHFDMQPALSLHALIVNQRPEVWEGSEFILSCMAYGSPDIEFTWYKDGIKVNFNGTTRDIWTRTVAEDALGRRMSVLGVSEAKKPDSGRWSCSADDAGRRRCSALRLTILRPPGIRLVPSSLTVTKGDNVSITCLAGAGRVHGTLGFSWARERTLLRLEPGREVWEDLYPAGSVLKLYNIQKSSEFRCQVSSVAGKNARGVTMWALGPKDEACESEASHGLRWPKTAPGAHASATCPPGHNGESTRFCEPKTTQHGVKWMLPDFSGCVSDSLREIYEQFNRISYGYSWDNVSNVAHQYGAVLRSLPAHPGEGTLPLQHTREMLHYLLSSAGKPKDRHDSVEHLLIIYDTLLKHPDTFLDEEKIYDLQNALVDTAAMRDSVDYHLQEFSVKSKQVREDGAAHFSFIPTASSDEWLLTSAGVELVARNGNSSVVAVQYHNLAARLPSLRRSIEFKGGRELEYRLASAQVQLTASQVDTSLQHTVTLLFVHSRNYTAIASKLACGLRTSSEPRTWIIKSCEVRIPEPTYVACRCRGLGTYALFTIARSTLTDAEKDLRGVVKITVGLGGAMCLAAAALQLLSLVPGRRARLPVFMKAATAGTHSAAMLTLLECDTRQEEACPGALGWVCAACWCAGCAALCAQPLLLQAELAGRAQRAPSVGLLAGVCILAWLTARLWGGAPLQIGSAAQAVCAAGCAMLTVLCFALAVCATLRLRTITHKVPVERRTYLKERSRVVRHTLLVLGTTTAAQAAGVWWAQPGLRTLPQVIVLSAAALANGLAMLVCYVIRDEECLQSARRVLSLPSHRDWQDSPVGDTSLSLYIKQGGEVESRGGVGVMETASSPSPISPVTSYWRAPRLESPAKMHRRQSTPDSRADIVRCVEYRDSLLSPHRFDPHRITTTHAVCDLIPHADHHTSPLLPQPEYMARVCLELGVLKTPPSEKPSPLLTCSVDFEPYTDKHFDTSKEACSICVQSNPDVSKLTSPPIKSCLKKTKKEFSSSISLPSMEVKEEHKSKSDIDQVNREWNKAYDSPETDRMLNKISNDLDFLLNRTQEKSVPDQIEEAPT
ncbi:jg6089 [Pararge aegeria aegeria]|uniref:Jg6089 protein n=1 Tax=Pararge aegeria aegeria TaxID=348720 RepID=A0A8S4S856_9NEOP|nr:jg6089 [Pararge aegeria aegeria]